MHGGNVWQSGNPADWLDYSANIRPQGAPDWVRGTLAKAMNDIGYYPAVDMHRAIRGMAAYLRLPEDMVFPTSGGISAIDLAVARGAERVLLLTPCFGEYGMAARMRGLPVETASLLGPDRRILRPAEAAAPVLKENSVVWLCDPLNPIGCAFPHDQIAELLELAEKRNCLLAVDEAFIEYCKAFSVREWIPEHDRLMITGSMTKILGIPGVRLGYFCAQGAGEFGRAKVLPWSLNCFAEAVAEALPEHREEIAADEADNDLWREEFRTGLEALGLYVYPSRSNFLLVDFGRDVGPIAEALKEKKILVRLCTDFAGVNEGHHLRLAVKRPETNHKFLNALKEIGICAENH